MNSIFEIKTDNILRAIHEKEAITGKNVKYIVMSRETVKIIVNRHPLLSEASKVNRIYGTPLAYNDELELGYFDIVN